MSHETDDIPEDVKQAAEVLLKWSNARCAAAVAEGIEKGDAKSFAMSSLECPDGTFIVVCGPEHAYCLEGWFAHHDASEHDVHGDETKGPSA